MVFQVFISNNIEWFYGQFASRFKVRKRPKIPEQNNDRLPDQSAADQAWKNHKLINDSIVVDVFQVCGFN